MADEIKMPPASVFGTMEDDATSPNRGEGGFLADVGNFFNMAGAVASDLNPTSGPRRAIETFLTGGDVNEAVADMSLGRETYETMQAQEEAGQDTFASNTLVGGMKGLTFGSLGTRQGIADAVAEGDFSNIGQYIDQANEKVNKNSNLLGEILGSLVSGGAIAGGANSMIRQVFPRMFSAMTQGGLKGAAIRSFVAGAGGATDAGVYALNEGKDIDQALNAAAWGGAFGMFGQGAMEGVQSLLASRAGTFAEQEIYDALSVKYGDEMVDALRGEGYIDEAFIARQMEGETDTLGETFPAALAKTVKSYTGSTDKEILRGIRDYNNWLVDTSSEARQMFDDSLMDILERPAHLTRESVQSAIAEARRGAPEHYSAVLARHADVAVPYDEVETALRSAFPDDISRSEQDLLDSLIRLAKPVGKGPKELTPRQLLRLRQGIDNLIYTKKGVTGTGNEATVLPVDSAIAASSGQEARAVVNSMLHDLVDDDQLRMLDNLYSETVALDNAYNAGRQLLAGKGKGADAVDLFMGSRSRSVAEYEQFVEGAKAQMIEDLEGKSAKAVAKYFDNNKKMDTFATLLSNPHNENLVDGDAIVQLLQENAQLLIRGENLGRMATEEIPSMVEESKSVIPTLVDLMLVGRGAAPGANTGAGAAFALRRLFTNAGPSGATRRSKALTFGDIMGRPANEAAGMVSEGVVGNRPAPVLGLPLGLSGPLANAEE